MVFLTVSEITAVRKEVGGGVRLTSGWDNKKRLKVALGVGVKS